MVCHPVVLKPDGHRFVAPHAGAHLLGAGVGHDGPSFTPCSRVQPGVKCRRGVLLVGQPFTSLPSLEQSSRDMMHPAAILVLVPVLAACTATREPFDPKVVLRALGVGVRHRDLMVENGDSDSGGMDPTAFLCRRYALDAMTAGFVVECGETFALDFEGDLVVARV